LVRSPEPSSVALEVVVAGTGVVGASDRVRPWWRQPAAWVALAVVFGLAVTATTILISVAIDGLVATSYRPDTAPRPDMAAAGAAWGGFPDTRGLELLTLEHDYLRDEGWRLVWRATPEAADRFVAAGGLAAEIGPCPSSVSPTDIFRRLDDCESAYQEWRRPDGNRISRRVSRGHAADGSLLIELELIDPN
jgi:hypothetical protein